MKPVTVNH